MAMNDSQKKRLENVWEALKHDKIAVLIFLEQMKWDVIIWLV